MNVPYLRATTYHQPMKSGTTDPQLFTCRDSSGQTDQYVVKLHCKLGYTIICEHMAALLGRALDLPIPPTAIVEIDPCVVSSYQEPELRKMLEDDPGPHFGSQMVKGGFTIVLPGFSPREDMLPQVIDIFAFDMLIQNMDRANGVAFGKPNMLSDGNRFIIIDHEKAFSFLELIASPEKPWVLRSTPMAEQHIFCGFLRHCKNLSGTCFSDFMDRFHAIDDATLEQMANTVPKVWKNPTKTDRIVAHLSNVRQNAAHFERGLLEAVS